MNWMLWNKSKMLVAVAVGSAMFCTLSLAQTAGYPNRPIRMIAPLVRGRTG